MRLVVTGASGFVGRGLLARLAAAGHVGVATGREPPGNIPAGWRAARRSDVLAGAVDPGDVAGVIHMEVKHHVPRPSAADIDAFEQVNVAGTRAWLDWAARHGVRRFIFVSSIKAVPTGDPSESIPRERGLAGRPSEPDTPYGRSKAAAEAAVRDWSAADAERAAVILRSAPVYGPGNEANLAAFVQQVIAGKPCLIGACDSQKSVVSRTNLAAAIEFASMHPVTGCEVFNVSDRETFSLGQLADMISDLAGAPSPRRIPRAVAGGLAVLGDLIMTVTDREFPLTSQRLRAMLETSVFPCTKLQTAGFQHPQTTRQGLAEMLAGMPGEPRCADRGAGAPVKPVQ